MANVLVNVPKTVKAGVAFEVKTLISHSMETGFRAGTSGRLIPRNIIERFTATFNGTEVYGMDMTSAIAANPFVAFPLAILESGTLVLRWTGDEGFAAEHTVSIAVG